MPATPELIESTWSCRGRLDGPIANCGFDAAVAGSDSGYGMGMAVNEGVSIRCLRICVTVGSDPGPWPRIRLTPSGEDV